MAQFARWLYPVCVRCRTRMCLVNTVAGDIHSRSLPIATFQCACGNAVEIAWVAPDKGQTGSLHNNSRFEYFLAVCKHGSFTAAALACGVSQPSVTGGVARLEREVGGKLLIRKKPVVPTPFGTQLRPCIETILSATDEIQRLSEARASKGKCA
jgi:hypothetical protein